MTLKSTLCLLGLLLIPACASGPQIVPAVPVVNVSCTWFVDGSTAEVSDNDCLVDRASAAADQDTTGVDASGNTVSPPISVDVTP